MRVTQAKNLFRELTERYFAGANVIFAHQSRVAKPNVPLVVITPGNVHRPVAPNYVLIDGVYVGHYLSRFSIQVDLFTHGSPVKDDETGETIALENTALDDMLSFADYLNSEYVVEWSHAHDVSILLEGDALDMTGVVNDNNYEFRSRLSVQVYFTQKTVGHAAVQAEDSILYPQGDGTYALEEPEETQSGTGDYVVETEPVVKPVFKETPSGGGSEELAQTETGYFTEVEIKEETGNE